MAAKSKVKTTKKVNLTFFLVNDGSDYYVSDYLPSQAEDTAVREVKLTLIVPKTVSHKILNLGEIILC